MKKSLTNLWALKWPWCSALFVALSFMPANATVDRGDGSIEVYNNAGIELNDQLAVLSLAFKEDNILAFSTMVSKEHPVMISSFKVSAEQRVGSAVHLTRIKDVASETQDLLSFMKRWRSRFKRVIKTKFKVSELKSVSQQGKVLADLRFEIVAESEEGYETHRGFFESVFQINENNIKLLELAPKTSEIIRGKGNDFIDEAQARGIDYKDVEDPRFLPPSEALRFQIIRHAIGGTSAFDLDNDGDEDLAFTGAQGVYVYKNDGSGNFVDVSQAVGLQNIGPANISIFSDLDNDGDQDLMIGKFIGKNMLFINDEGVFKEVSEASGILEDPMTSGLSIFDADGDGLLDIYVARFLDARKDIPDMVHWARNGLPNRLYLNQGNMRFKEVAKERGADDTGLGLGLITADLDADGDQDIYAANDFGRNVYLENQGGGHFKDVAKEKGALAVSAGMAASTGDVDGDGDLDLYVSSIRSNQRWFSVGKNYRAYVFRALQTQRRKRLPEVLMDLRKYQGDAWDEIGQLMLGGNYLLENEGDGFSDVSRERHAQPHGFYWGSGFIDIDNDGNLDIYAANGWISGKKTHDL